MEQIKKTAEEPIPMIVELFGHTKISGMVSEYQRFGSTFVRVDVPQTPFNAPFSRILHPNAVYAFNPVDKETMQAMAERLHVMPLDPFEIGPVMKAIEEKEAKRQIALMEQSESEKFDESGPYSIYSEDDDENIY